MGFFSKDEEFGIYALWPAASDLSYRPRDLMSFLLGRFCSQGLSLPPSERREWLDLYAGGVDRGSVGLWRLPRLPPQPACSGTRSASGIFSHRSSNLTMFFLICSRERFRNARAARARAAVTKANPRARKHFVKQSENFRYQRLSQKSFPRDSSKKVNMLLSTFSF